MNLITKITTIVFLITILFSCKKNTEVIKENLVLATVKHDKSFPSFETSDGTLLHLKTFGVYTNPVLLVLHGGPGILDISSYESVANLKDNYFVILFDQRGSGLSERVGADKISGETNLQDIKDIKEAFAPNDKINILGHSFGGYLAAYFATSYPNDVNKLILAESMPLSENAMQNVGPIQNYGKINPDLEIVSDVNNYLHPDAFAVEDYRYAIAQNSIGIQDDMMPGEDAKKTVPLRYGYLANKEMISWLGLTDGTFKNLNVLDDFDTKFTGQVLLIGASNSKVGYDFMQTYLKPYISNATLVKVENSAHFIFTFNTEPTLNLIRNFLQ